jgi:hypothetical protein
MRSLLKTVLLCSIFSLFAILSLAEDRPQQAHSSVPTPAKLRVLITDCVDKTSTPDPEVRRDVTGALYVALDGFGKNSFDVITQQEVWAAAGRLGLPVPESTAPSRYWTEDDKIRLSKALNADLLCKVAVAWTKVPKRANSYVVAVEITLTDIALQFPRAGGYAIVYAKTLSKAVTLVVNDAAQQCPKRLFLTAHVLSRMDDRVRVDLGVQGGVRVADDMGVWREIAGKRIKVGLVEVIFVYPTYSEARIVSETGGIQAGDAIFVYWSPGIGVLPLLSK